MTWELRRATSDDLDAIMAIENSVFASDAWSPSVMRAELGDQHGYYVVAFRPDSPGEIEAYAGLHSPLREPQADIQTIAVIETARRSGLGRVLMQQLIGQARQRGATDVFLEVRADNPGAKSLYRSLRFEQIAVRPKYYQPDGVDAIVMKLVIAEPRVGVA